MKGKWEVRVSKKSVEVWSTYGLKICSLSTRLIDREASARMIAAAPDLLAALEGVLPYVPGGHEFDHDDIGRPWLQVARAAIAKAKGENDG